MSRGVARSLQWGPVSSTTPRHRAPARAGSPRLTVLVLCFGGLAASLMQTLVIPIQTKLPLLLHTSEANSSWVITATLLAAAVTMPVAGRLADMLGKQRVLVVSSLLLVLGSLTCALSSSLAPMLVGRVLQGLAMGFIPVGISLMREVVPPAMASTAVAAMSATLGVGGAIGLPLSAFVAERFDWHALFWMSAGMAAVVALTVAVLVPHVHDSHGGRFDALGAVGLAVGLVGVLVAVSKGNEWGWGEARTLLFLGVGLAVLVAWAAYELRAVDPLCDLRTTTRAPVLLTNLAAVAIGFGMMAQAIVMPQLLQMPHQTGYGLGQTMLQAGLWMAPGGLMMLVFAPVSSRLMDRVGPKPTLMLGAAVLGVGYVLATFSMHAAWSLMVATIVASAGVGIGYAAMPTLVLDAVPAREAGSAVGINALMRSVGTSVASAVMAALLTSSMLHLGPYEVPTEGAFRLCFVVGAAAAFVGVLIAATIPAGRARRAAAEAGEAAQPSTVREVELTGRNRE